MSYYDAYDKYMNKRKGHDAPVELTKAGRVEAVQAMIRSNDIPDLEIEVPGSGTYIVNGAISFYDEAIPVKLIDKEELIDRYYPEPTYTDKERMIKYKAVTVTYLESLEDGTRTELTDELADKMEITYE